MKIILASSSEYRKNLLTALIPSFECIAPHIDESLHKTESASEYVTRLALEKAKCVALQQEDSLVIGSDQCAVLDSQIITKPKNPDEAVKQLSAAAGKSVNFYTGLCLYNSTKNSYQLLYDSYKVKFRCLSKTQIHSYLQKDQPYDCAGSFKSEGLGIALFESMQGEDPNTLIGLPLIKLVGMLDKEGIDVLTYY